MFREETNERLDRIEATLLTIEAGGTGGDSINSLFRDAHSINGNAGMIGFDEARRIAQGMEEVLASAREAGVLEPALAAGMSRAAGSIRRAILGEPVPDRIVPEWTSGDFSTEPRRVSPFTA
jgi:HPt (histidine-containing phosphotransfer) domain-containing protein